MLTQRPKVHIIEESESLVMRPGLHIRFVFPILFACPVLVTLQGCDGLHDIEEPVIADNIDLARQWYQKALPKQQATLALGKQEDSSVLEAMVEQYPPDWSQAVTLPLQGDAVRVATLLGPQQSNVTHSHDSLAAIRTIVLDVGPNSEVYAARLLEFVSPADLSAGDFADYIVQWEQGDFQDVPMLISEYDIAYSHQLCELYTPQKGFTPVDVRLEASSSLGKTNATYYCWVSDFQEAWTCPDVPVPIGEQVPPNHYCIDQDKDIEITCVTVEKGECTQDCGGDGGDGGDGPPAGGGGGGSNPLPPTFSLACDPSKVVRGNEVTCKVTAKDSSGSAIDFDINQYPINWNSSTGGTHSGSKTWSGTATGNATISVAVSGGNTPSVVKITVNDRHPEWAFESLHDSVKYATMVRQMPYRLGSYQASLPSMPGFKEVTSGPWKGQYLVGTEPKTRKGELLISDDYKPGGGPLKFADASRKTCKAVPNSLDTANYHQVNTNCGTLSELDSWREDIIAHERHHEAGFSACLTGPRGSDYLKALANVHGSEEKVIKDATAARAKFIPEFLKAGKQGTRISSGTFWYHHGAWSNKRLRGGGERGNHGCPY